MLLPRALSGIMQVGCKQSGIRFKLIVLRLSCLQALVSVRRLEDFLNAEELSNTERSPFTGSGPSGTTPFQPPNSGLAKVWHRIHTYCYFPVMHS